MGLGGLACAMLGAAVVLTDTAEVLPLLARNYEANLSPAALRVAGSDLAGAVGAVEVRCSCLSSSLSSSGTSRTFAGLLAACM